MNSIYAIIFDIVIFGLLLTSFLLYKFGKKFPYFIMIGIMTIVFLISFIALFMWIKSQNDVYIPFFIGMIFVTYSNKYIAVFFKKCDFGLNNDYRIPMQFFLLVLLGSLVQGKDILNFGLTENSSMNMILITILGEQLLNQLILNYNIDRKVNFDG